MNRFTHLLGTTALTAAVFGGSHAAFATLTLTESNAYASAVPTQYGTGGLGAGPTQTINLAGFNSLLPVGTDPSTVNLDSVKVTVADTITGQATATYTATTKGSFYFSNVYDQLTTTYVPAALAGIAPLTIVSSGGVGSIGHQVGVGSFYTGTGGNYSSDGTVYTSNVLSGSASVSATATGNSTTLASFLTGWHMSFSEIGSYTGSGTSNVGLNANTSGDVSVSVVYTYDTTATPAPEPASVALLASALTGVGVIRRRRKS
jgi:hypothetical protein